MITIISPAKTMDFDAKTPDISTSPIFKNEIKELMSVCKNLTHQDIKQLMSISDKLTDLNYNRFQNFFDTKTPKKQALFAYNGDVYNGIKTESFSKEDTAFAQESIRVISGLYGVLRPLDLISPYRLEMGIKLKNNLGKNLYSFWKEKITKYISKELENHHNKILINLASNEYSDAVNRDTFSGKIIDIVFKEKRNGKIKIAPINSKRARGMMANFIIKEKIDNPEKLKNFQEGGYRFNKDLSSNHQFLFIL